MAGFPLWLYITSVVGGTHFPERPIPSLLFLIFYFTVASRFMKRMAKHNVSHLMVEYMQRMIWAWQFFRIEINPILFNTVTRSVNPPHASI